MNLSYFKHLFAAVLALNCGSACALVKHTDAACGGELSDSGAVVNDLCRPANRAFVSAKVEECIDSVQSVLSHPKLSRMFALCFPNTLDTTVKYRKLADGDDDTFVITGDIPAMWLRDSAAQVWPYLRFAAADGELRRLIRGVVRRQLRCLLIDTYANAFMECPDSFSTMWRSDYTEMRPGVFERKYEIDSQCYPVRLAYAYWKQTGDATIFDDLWLKAITAVYNTMKQQQGAPLAAVMNFSGVRTLCTTRSQTMDWGIRPRRADFWLRASGRRTTVPFSLQHSRQPHGGNLVAPGCGDS